MKETIIEKLNNNDFNFSEEENSLLANDTELVTILISIIDNNPELLHQNGKKIDHIIDTIENQDIIPLILQNNFIFHYLEYELNDKHRFADDETFNYLNETQKQVYIEHIKQKLINDDIDYSYFIRMPAYFLEIVLQEKRYDLFDKFRNISPIPDEILEQLKEYINNTSGELPGFLGEYCDVLDLPYDRYPTETLIDIYNESYDIDVAKILVDRIINSPTMITKNNISLKMFKDAGYDINDPDVKQHIFDIFLDRNYIADYVDYMSEEEFKRNKDRLINVINNPDSIIKKISNKYDDLDLLDALIKSGRCNFAIEDKNFFDYVEENFDEAIDGLIKYFASPDSDYFACYRILTKLVKIEEFNDYVYEYLKTHDNNICFVDKYIIESNMLEKCVHENQVDLFKRIMLSVSFIEYDFDREIIDYLITLLNDDKEFNKNFLTSNSIYLVNNKELSEYFIKQDEESARMMLNRYNHTEEDKIEYTKDVYDYTKDFLCRDYRITNIQHLDYLAEHFGYDIVRYISNDQIIKLLNLSDEEFNQIIRLFDGEYTYNDAITLYDSLKQLEFSKNNPDIINIFANIKHQIEDKTILYKPLIEIADYIDDKFYERNPSLIEAKQNEEQYLMILAQKIMSGKLSEEEEKNYYEIIHTFTNYYIAQHREKYRETYDLEHECNVDSEYDSKDLKDKFIKYKLLSDYNREIMDILCTTYGLKDIEAHDIISYYINKTTSWSYRNDSEEKTKYENSIKSKIRLLIKVVNDFINEKNIKITPNFSGFQNIKKIYKYDSKKKINKILAELNIDQIKEHLLVPEKKQEYDLLLSLMKKYKLHIMPEYFNDLVTRLDLSNDLTNMARFINYFYKIIELEKRNAIKKGLDPEQVTFNAISIFKDAEVFSSVSRVYSQILGPEDSKLIKLNPAPNAASSAKSTERLEKAANQTIKNYQRTKIHIPAFNEIVSFKSYDKIKKIRVVAGNFTHPSNLTHGERTGACMRIGGVGDSLFDFCLNNEYGFHIRFEDAETGEYISRVSGFRNGNSVFLNELRESCDPALFSSKDVIEACKVAGELLIERSKESKIPIDNVFVHRAYATKNDTTCPVINFKGKNIKEGLPHFYSDISSFGLLLASSVYPPKNISLSTELPDYLPAREIPYYGDNQDKLSSMINRVNIVKHIINGEDKALIESPINEEEKIIYGIVSQDFYIYIDERGIVHEDIINIDPRARKELEEARIKIQEHIKPKHLPSLEGLNQEEEKAIEIQISQQPVIIEDISEQEGQIHR